MSARMDDVIFVVLALLPFLCASRAAFNTTALSTRRWVASRPPRFSSRTINERAMRASQSDMRAFEKRIEPIIPGKAVLLAWKNVVFRLRPGELPVPVG